MVKTLLDRSRIPSTSLPGLALILVGLLAGCSGTDSEAVEIAHKMMISEMKNGSLSHECAVFEFSTLRFHNSTVIEKVDVSLDTSKYIVSSTVTAEDFAGSPQKFSLCALFLWDQKTGNVTKPELFPVQLCENPPRNHEREILKEFASWDALAVQGPPTKVAAVVEGRTTAVSPEAKTGNQQAAQSPPVEPLVPEAVATPSVAEPAPSIPVPAAAPEPEAQEVATAPAVGAEPAIRSDTPYVIVASSIKQEKEGSRELAESVAAKLRGAGFAAAEVLDSHDYPNLKCCFWVVSAGAFAGKDEAAALADRLRAADFQAYVKNAFK